VRRDEIDSELKDATFEFFYWFSRFEFALKENKHLKDRSPGAKAKPDWESFVEKYAAQFSTSAETENLIRLHPKQQIISDQGLDWRPVGLSHCNGDLCRVVTMLRTVRNNLFHGGKHGDRDVDDRKRNLELLKVGKVVLDQLAKMAGFDGDYTRYY
jgi:hypothetical protein